MKKESNSTQPPVIGPVFVGGCARSGTTFLAKKIADNFDFIVTPESQFKINEHLVFDGNECRVLLSGFLELLKASPRFRSWELSDWEALFQGMAARPLYRDVLQSLVRSYANKSGMSDSPWLDHTPENARIFPLLKGIFPCAKFIHIIRDGRAVYNSVKGLPWGPTCAREASRWWESQTYAGLAQAMFFHEDVLCVRYEDLVAGAGFSQVHDFLLRRNYIANSKDAQIVIPNYSKQQHKLVLSEAEKSRINAYKGSLPAAEVDLFTNLSYPLLKALGYETPDAIGKPNIGIIEKLRQRCKRVYLTQISYRLRNYWRFLK